MKTVRFELPHGTELHTLDELSGASTVANQIQSALVISFVKVFCIFI